MEAQGSGETLERRPALCRDRADEKNRRRSQAGRWRAWHGGQAGASPAKDSLVGKQAGWAEMSLGPAALGEHLDIIPRAGGRDVTDPPLQWSCQWRWWLRPR